MRLLSTTAINTLIVGRGPVVFLEEGTLIVLQDADAARIELCMVVSTERGAQFRPSEAGSLGSKEDH